MTSAPARGASTPARGRRPAVLLDTGPLVALYARDDPRHEGVAKWAAGFHGEWHTVEPVLTEAAYFLPARTRAVLADLAHRGTLHLHRPGQSDFGRIAALMRKYADRDPDWADISLVWFAESSGIHRIATLDADFSVYRIHGRKRFELELLG